MTDAKLLSKNKRKADNVVKSVNHHEAQEAPVALPIELEHPSSKSSSASRSNSPKKLNVLESFPPSNNVSLSFTLFSTTFEFSINF